MCEVCGWQGDDVIGRTGCGTGRAAAIRGEREGNNEREGKKHVTATANFAVKKELYAGEESLSETDAAGTVGPRRDVQHAAAVLTSSQGTPRSLIGKGVCQGRLSRAFVKGTSLMVQKGLAQNATAT